MAALVVIGFPNEAKADEGNDSYRPVFSGNQDRTHESRMNKSTSPLSALVFAFALWAVMPPSIAAASTASETVREFYQTLLYNMQNGPSVGQRGRVARLAPVVPRVFDIPYMTQLAIGPTWIGHRAIRCAGKGAPFLWRSPCGGDAPAACECPLWLSSSNSTAVNPMTGPGAEWKPTLKS